MDWKRPDEVPPLTGSSPGSFGLLSHTLGLVLCNWRLVPRQPPAPLWPEGLWLRETAGLCWQGNRLRVFIPVVDWLWVGAELWSALPASGEDPVSRPGDPWWGVFISRFCSPYLWMGVWQALSRAQRTLLTSRFCFLEPCEDWCVSGPRPPLWDNGVWSVSACAD